MPACTAAGQGSAQLQWLAAHLHAWLGSYTCTAEVPGMVVMRRLCRCVC
jgi:hypothetical protein